MKVIGAPLIFEDHLEKGGDHADWKIPSDAPFLETMRRIVIAPERVELEGPVVFLAGPTRCPWHEPAMGLLHALDPELHVASPKRPVDTEKDFGDADYAEQVDWETAFLQRAGEKGVVLFWLARELEHRCERPHAQTIRFELGEWKERCRRDGVARARDRGGLHRRTLHPPTLRPGVCPRVKVCSSLAETCAEAARLARSES